MNFTCHTIKFHNCHHPTPGFKFEESTTTTTTDTSLIDDILSSIEQDDLAKLLPKDFGPLPDFSKNKSRPKPPRLFQKTSEATSSTTTTTKALSTSTEKPTTTKSKNPSFLDSLKFDDVSAFLPPGKFHDLCFCYPCSDKYPFIGTIISWFIDLGVSNYIKRFYQNS